ncbi:ras association domain-containing protein 7-like [Aplochiton taeniatus]
MELKVWVEGVARVVCGLTLETSCQEVVIALAQATGQTGRYVLIQKLRGSERQLVANDCPLQSLGYLGQMGSEVQFILRRTGPSRGELDPVTVNQLSKSAEPPPPKRSEPHKALTFNLGPSTVPRRTKTTRAWSPSPRASPEPRASPVPFLVYPHPALPSPPAQSKEAVFREVLQQQERVWKLEAQLKDLERETQDWLRSSPAVPGLTLGLKEETEVLERRLESNADELEQEEYLEEQLQKESEKEQDMDRQLGQIRRSLDDYSYQLQDLQTNSARLDQNIQLEAQRQSSKPDMIQTERALSSLKDELHSRQQHGAELETSLTETERELQAVEARIQDRCVGVEELNKDLRQCNLQQFILQAGVPPAPSHNDLPPTEPTHTMPPAASYLYSAGIVEEDQTEPVSVC